MMKDVPSNLENSDSDSPKEKVENIPAVQGLEQLSEARAEQNKELISDLEKFKDRPTPAYVSKEQIDQSREEVDASITKLEKEAKTEELRAQMIQDNISPSEQEDILTSSPELPEFKVNDDPDKLVFRHWGGKAEKESNWVTPEFERPYFAKSDQNIPDENTMEKVTTFRLKQGAHYYESKANKYIGTQYYVVNPKVNLEEIKTIKDRNQ